MMSTNHNRCVIFGGGGFIGSHLAEALVKKNNEVIIFSRNSDNSQKNLSKIISKIQFIKEDFNDMEFVNKVIRPNDIIFDLVASSVPASSQQFPTREITLNILPHINLMEGACKKKVKKIIYISSGGGIYGQKDKLPVSETDLPQPISPHSISKITTEYFLHYVTRLNNISYTIYRLSNVYGPKQVLKAGFGIVPTLFDHVLKDKPPLLFDHGKLIRDFIYIEDVIQAIVSSFDKNNNWNVYNIGSGNGTTINELWNIIKKLAGTKLNPKFEPKRPFDVSSVVLDIHRFQNEFKWSPTTSVSDGLLKTWEWVKTF